MPRHLRYAGLQGRTLRAYRLAVDRFLTYVRIHKLPLRSQDHVDAAVGEYINTLYQEGDSLAHAGHLLSGLKRFCPGMRLGLPTASQYFRNWQRVHRPERAIPISWDLLQAMAGLCLTLGHLRVALLLYIGYFCFLRTSEMMSLQCLHLIPDRRSARVTVIVPFAKTSEGNPQVLIFKDARVHKLTLTVLNACGSQDYLWSSTSTQFRSFWICLLEAVGFSSEDYLPYGIRRGGATWFFLTTGSMDATLHRGRWSCSKTARMYIDQGTLSMARTLWSARQRKCVKKWALKGATYLARLRQQNVLGMGVLEVSFSPKICAWKWEVY